MSIFGYGGGYDVILQIGDSNSYSGVNVDGSPSYDPAVDTVGENCYEWRSGNRATDKPTCYYLALANAFHPLDYALASQTTSSAATMGVGPGENFVKWWQVNQAGPNGRRTIITVEGVGGSGLCNTTNTTTAPAGWQVTPVMGNGVPPAIAKVNLVLSEVPNSRIACILWTSGANDAIFEHGTGLSTSTYQTAFIALANYLRSNITGASSCPILLQPLVPAFVTNVNTVCPNTNAALATMPSVLSQCGYADPTGYTLLGQTAIAYHLCADAQRLIGSTLFPNAYLGRSV